jgi:hypothetical protein
MTLTTVPTSQALLASNALSSCLVRAGAGACLDKGDPCDRPSVGQLLAQFAYRVCYSHPVSPRPRFWRATGSWPAVPLPPHWRTSRQCHPHPAVAHANENRFRAQTSFASTTNRIHPHGVTRSPDRATGQESYGQRLPQGQETRVSVEHAQTLSRTVLILGDSRNPPVNSRRANEARTSARSCAVSISLHHRPLMRTVFTSSVEAIRLMTS